jgi:polar amino acid transport system substrate-binding protein
MNAIPPTAGQAPLVLSALADRLVYGNPGAFDSVDAHELTVLPTRHPVWHRLTRGGMPRTRARIDLPGTSSAGVACGMGNVSIGGDCSTFDLDSRGGRVTQIERVPANHGDEARAMRYSANEQGTAMPAKFGFIFVGLAVLMCMSAPLMAAAQTLKVGANIGNVPWEFEDSNGNDIGFEIDLVNAIGKRLGLTVSIVNIPFAGLFAAVQSGQIDAAVSSITITKSRLQSVGFTQPYYDSDQSLAVRADSGLTGLKDLAGKTVGVDTGSTGDIWATKHQSDLKIVAIQRYEGLSPAMLDLAAGRIDGYISDIPALQFYIKDKPTYRVVARIPTGEQYSIMFAKNAPLADKVDAVITRLKKDGTIADLYEKWFGVRPEANTTTVMAADRPKL